MATIVEAKASPTTHNLQTTNPYSSYSGAIMIIIHNQAKLDALAAAHNRLEARYQIESVHGVIFDLFIEAPDYFEKWIHIYFGNPTLFRNRSNGGILHLLAFLQAGPEDVLLALLLAERMDTRPAADYLPLLPAQVRAVKKYYLERFRNCGASAIQWLRNQQDRDLCTENGVAVHDNRYIQPMKHFEPTAKWKSRGWVHL